MVLSEFILSEFEEKLIAKFGSSRSEARAAVLLLRTKMTIVVPRVVDPGVCRDPNDAPIIGTALAGGCQCLVTGDKDLLALLRFEDIEIVAPADFWRHEARQKAT